MKHLKKHPINDKAQKLSKDMKKQDLVKPKTDKVLDADDSLSDPKITKRVVKPSNKKLSSEKHLSGGRAKKVNENLDSKISFDEEIKYELFRYLKGSIYDKVGKLDDRVKELMDINRKFIENFRTEMSANEIAKRLFKYEKNLNDKI